MRILQSIMYFTRLCRNMLEVGGILYFIANCAKSLSVNEFFSKLVNFYEDTKKSMVTRF